MSIAETMAVSKKLRNAAQDLSAEIAELDKAIIMHGIALDKLKTQRFELYAHQEDLDLQNVVDCVIDNSMTPQEAINAILSYMQHPQSA